MRRRLSASAFLLVIVFISTLGLGMQIGLTQEKQQAADTIGVDEIRQRLDEVLSNQSEILKQFEEIKSALDIIKVRVSRASR